MEFLKYFLRAQVSKFSKLLPALTRRTSLTANLSFYFLLGQKIRVLQKLYLERFVIEFLLHMLCPFALRG